MSQRGSRLWWIVVVLAFGGAATWAVWPRLSSRHPATDSANPTTRAPTTVEPSAPATDTDDRPPRRPPAQVAGSAPAGCPDEDADPPEFVRPSVWDVLQIRTEELRDRLPQLQRDASEDLRGGLNGLNQDDPMAAVDRLRRAPDRERDGFDVAVAAMLHLGMRHLGVRNAGRSGEADARYWGRAVVREAPRDPAAHALAALAAERAGATDTAERHYGAAYELAPDEPAIALAYAMATSKAGHFARAAEAAERYLASTPEDTRIAHWRTRMSARAELVRQHARRTDLSVTVLWPDRSVDVRRVDELSRGAYDAMHEVAARAQVPERAGLVIVIYETPDDMRRATCAPSWSGGVFDGVLHLDAATVRGPRFERVIRHEATHAQLAVLRRRIPSWLGEGFAQEMEGPVHPNARRAWQRMVSREFWIPFASLEGTLIAIEDSGDAGLAYHQSLAMFLYLRERGGPGGIPTAFHHVREGRTEDLLARLVEGADGRALLAFMASHRE